MLKPFVGAWVRYVYPWEDRCSGCWNEEGFLHVPALVTRVREDGTTVDLTVFAPGIRPEATDRVTPIKYDSKKADYTWHWPEVS